MENFLLGRTNIWYEHRLGSGLWSTTENLVTSFISESRSEPNVGGQWIKLANVISESHPV